MLAQVCCLRHSPRILSPVQPTRPDLHLSLRLAYAQITTLRNEVADVATRQQAADSARIAAEQETAQLKVLVRAIASPSV